jgi:flagellar motor switch protein FliN
MAEPTTDPAPHEAAIGEATPTDAAAAPTAASGSDPAPNPNPAAAPAAALTEAAAAAPAAPEASLDLSQLPAHTRSLLKIRVPVTVTLAHQRRPIKEITELGPGTLVKFEKTYDEPLQLTVGDLPIARGEVVKVGDKFGLRIRQLIRPHERFASVVGPKS